VLNEVLFRLISREPLKAPAAAPLSPPIALQKPPPVQGAVPTPIAVVTNGAPLSPPAPAPMPVNKPLQVQVSPTAPNGHVNFTSPPLSQPLPSVLPNKVKKRTTSAMTTRVGAYIGYETNFLREFVIFMTQNDTYIFILT
jgi:hypothetical protein